MNPRLTKLFPYPFERLRTLLADAVPPEDLPHISMSIGEPRHAPPPFILEALTAALNTLGTYPQAHGLPELRRAIGEWLQRRFNLPAGSVDPETMVVPVNGTREALFAFVQAAVDTGQTSLSGNAVLGHAVAPGKASGSGKAPIVAMPNPFYQIYEGAALLAGAEPYFLNTVAGNDFTPDLDAVPEEIWQRCQILFLCTPGNPTGTVLSVDYLRHALQLAERYDFLIAGDECYAEIYRDEATPPPGLLQAALAAGHPNFERCLVFHSLSKRSSVPGLRSGFVAGDPRVLKQYLLYRTYHGCAVAVHTQLASIPAWQDDAHVRANRTLYREKFATVLPILRSVMEVPEPAASFYLWPDVGDDERFTRELFEQKHLTLLPGSYLARDTASGNPGRGRVRISLVASVQECAAAAERIRDFVSRRAL